MTDIGVRWVVWREETEAKGFRVRCSVCGREMEKGVVFPEYEMKVCPGCLWEMNSAIARELLRT